MRQDFDRSVPEMEQRLRVANAKQPGRKHQKRPGARANEARRASAKRAAALASAKFRKFKARVAAYWRGESDTYPEQAAE